MKKNKYSIVILPAVLMLSIGCSSYSPNDMYAEQLLCNGELETSHSVTIFTTEKDKEPQSPKITQTCVPAQYETETDFEKENRRVK